MLGTFEMTCPNCGYNPDMLTEYMKTVTSNSRIEQRIKELEAEIVKQKKEENWKQGCYFDDFGKNGRIKELKDLLGKGRND